MEKKTKIILLLIILVLATPIIMISGVVIWQLGVFSTGSSSYPSSSSSSGGMNRATGFVTVKSFDRTIQYAEDGTLSVVMTNAAGAPITDVQMSFTEDCNGATYSIGEIAAGDTVTVSVDCSPKNSGDTFMTSVNAAYTIEIAGTFMSRTDSGRLTGTVE